MEAACGATIDATLVALYRSAGRKVFATLVRLLGSFERAEEALLEHAATRRCVTNFAEAIRLGRLLLTLLPEPEVQRLLALRLLHGRPRGL